MTAGGGGEWYVETSDLVDGRPRAARGAALAGRCRQAVAEHPLLIGALSLLAGALVGLALPSTRREDELLGDSRDEVLASARATGREAVEKGKAAALQLTRDAADTLREAQADLARSLAGQRDVHGGSPTPSAPPEPRAPQLM